MAGGGGGGNASLIWLDIQLKTKPEDIKSQIEGVLSSIKPIELKVDDKSLSNVKSAIKELTEITKKPMGNDAIVKQMDQLFAQTQKTTQAIERLAEANEKVASASKKGSKGAVDDVRAQLQVLKQVNTEYAKVLGYLERYTAAESGSGKGAYDSLVKCAAALKEMDSELRNSSSVSDGFKTSFLAIQEAVATANRQIKGFHEATKAATTSETILSKGSAEQAKALKQVSAEYEKVTKYLKNYTAAQGGKSSNAYADLSNQQQALQNLMNTLNTGQMSAEAFKNSFSGIQGAVATANQQIVAAGENTQKLSERMSFFGQLSSNFGQALVDRLTYMFSATRLINEAIRGAKEMIKESIEIESAMAQIQVVTGSTDVEMERFFTTSTQLAKELGQSITDVSKSIETFSRLGFKLGDAEELAKFATVLSNVADTNVTEATTGLTSIIKGYSMDVSEVEHVTDVLTTIGQKYAISASELLTAFERGGASMAAANTSFEKTASLFAATQASLQNASTVGVLWKTVSARIRNSVTELQEMGEDTSDLADGFSKYREELLALTGVDIQDGEDKYRDLYDIFVDLAEVWDDLESDMARARVSEILGGTRNQSGIASTIINIKDAIGAYKDAMDSSGVAMQANDIVMDTTAKHIEQLKVAFQELAVSAANSDLLKFFVDLATGILNCVNAIGPLNAAIMALGGISIAKNLGNLKAVFSAIGSDILSGAFTGGGFIGFFSELGASLSLLVSALGGPVVAAIVGVGAAIATVTGIINANKKAEQDRLKAAAEATNKYKEDSQSLEDYKSEIETLQEKLASSTTSEQEAYSAKSRLAEIQRDLTETYGDATDGLNLFNDKLEDQLDIYDKLEQKKAKDYLSQITDEYGSIEQFEERLHGTLGGDRGTRVGQFVDGFTEESEAINEILDKYKDLFETVEVPGGMGDKEVRFIGSAADSARLGDFINDIREARDELRETYGGAYELMGLDSLFDEGSQVLDQARTIQQDYGEIYKQVQRAKLLADETQYASGKTAVELLRDYSDAVDKYNRAVQDGNEHRIAETSEEYKRQFELLHSLLDNDEGFSAYREDVEAIEEALSVIIKREQTLKQMQELSSGFDENRAVLKSLGLNETQFKDTLLDYILNPSFDEAASAVSNVAYAFAMLNGISLDELGQNEGLLSDLLDILVQMGDVSKDAAESTEDAFTSVADILSSDGDFQKAYKEFDDKLKDVRGYIEKAAKDELTPDDIVSFQMSYGDVVDFKAEDVDGQLKDFYKSLIGDIETLGSETQDVLAEKFAGKTGERIGAEGTLSALFEQLIRDAGGLQTEAGQLAYSIWQSVKEALALESDKEGEPLITVDTLLGDDSDFKKEISGYEDRIKTLKDYIIKANKDELTADDKIEIRTSELVSINEDINAQTLTTSLKRTTRGISERLRTMYDQATDTPTKQLIRSLNDYLLDYANEGLEDVEEVFTGSLSELPRLLDKNSEFGKAYSEAKTNINTLISARDKIAEGKFETKDLLGLQETFGELAKYDLSNIGDGVNAELEKITSGLNLLELAEKAGVPAGSELYQGIEQLVSGLIDLASAAAGMTAFENLNASIDDFTSYQSNIASALKDSSSAAGLNAKDIEALFDAYKDLDGFDAKKLFEDTGHGVRLNYEELERLNAEVEKNTLVELYRKLADSRRELEAARSAGQDTSGLENDIAQAELLISEYEGLTSAYEAWQQAKSGGNERDSYESVGADYDNMKEIYDLGWFNDKSLNAYLDLLLGENRTGDVAQDWEKLNSTIGDTGKTLMDFWRYDEESKKLSSDGLIDLLGVLNQYDDSIVQVGEDGSYSFNATTENIQKMAEFLHTSPEMVELFIRALNDVEKVDVFEDVAKEIQEANKNLQETPDSEQAMAQAENAALKGVGRIREAIGELKAEDATVDVQTEIEGDEELSAIAEEIAQLPPEVQTKVGIEPTTDVTSIIDQLTTNYDTTAEVDVETNYEGEKEEMPDLDQTVNLQYEGEKTSMPNLSQLVNLTYSGLMTSLPTITQVVQQVVQPKIGEARGTLSGAHASGTISMAKTNGSSYNVANLRSLNSAYANGKVSLSRDEVALVNEIGTESIIKNFVTLCSNAYRIIYLIAGNP